MYFLNKIKEITEGKETILFVDMDGVIADYEVNKSLDFATKRPIYTNINTLEEISKLKNIELHILSICRHDKEIEIKNKWLDKNASFFIKENRTIISKKSNSGYSRDLKLNYLKEFIEHTNKIIIFIDDDNDVLRHITDNLDDKIILFQDSSIID